MRRIAYFVILLSAVSFFVTQKNSTINVERCEVITNGKDIDWLVHTTEGQILVVPNNKNFSWDAATNWMTLNFDYDRDWKRLQSPGQYHVRTYGLRSLVSDNGIKIIRVLDSPDENPVVLSYFKAIKKIAVPVFNDITDYVVALTDGANEDAIELDEYLKDK